LPAGDGGQVSVLVVDDGPFRTVVCDVVRSTPGFELFGAAASGEAAIELSSEAHPDLVLMDIRLPGLDGFETAERLVRRHPSVVVVLLSSHRAEDVAAAYGSAGFELIAKDALSRALLRSVWDRRRPGAGVR
jgi:two-component system response regulator AlgR